MVGGKYSNGGEKYSDGIRLGTGGRYALFNFNSTYSTIKCTITHIGRNQEAKAVAFIVDGKTVKEVELEAEALSKKFLFL